MTKFADGIPGDPGRPRGSRNRLNKLLDDALGGDHIASSEMSPEEAEALTSVFETHRRAFELVTQEQRVEKLEAEVREFHKKLQ